MATVPQIISDQQAYAQSWVVQAEAFINRVANLADTQFSVSVPTSLGFGLTDIVNDAFDRIENRTPVRPTFAQISASLPSAPVVSFLDIDSSIITALQTKLLTDLEDGGYGIETSDEALIWQRAMDREVAGALALEEQVDADYAAGGFSIPPVALFAAKARAREEGASKISGLSRDIAIKRADLFVQNRQFTIQQLGTVQGIILQMHNVLLARIQAMTAVYGAQLQGFRADIDGQIETVRANLGVYVAEVQAFAAVTSALKSAYDLKLNEAKFNADWNVEVVRSRLQEAQVRLSAQQATASLNLGAATFGSNFYSNIVAAALGSINTLTAQTTTS